MRYAIEINELYVVPSEMKLRLYPSNTVGIKNTLILLEQNEL